MARRERSGPRHNVHWKAREWEQRQAEEYEARRRQRATERQSRGYSCLILIGLLLWAGLTGSTWPLTIFVFLMMISLLLCLCFALGDWLQGR